MELRKTFAVILSLFVFLFLDFRGSVMNILLADFFGALLILFHVQVGTLIKKWEHKSPWKIPDPVKYVEILGWVLLLYAAFVVFSS